MPSVNIIYNIFNLNDQNFKMSLCSFLISQPISKYSWQSNPISKKTSLYARFATDYHSCILERLLQNSCIQCFFPFPFTSILSEFVHTVLFPFPVHFYTIGPTVHTHPFYIQFNSKGFIGMRKQTFTLPKQVTKTIQ